MSGQQPYQLRVCDLRTDKTLSVIEIEDVTYDDFIGKTGSLNGTINLPDRTIARTVRDTLLPGRTMLHLEQEDGLVWSGVLWVRTPTRSERGFYTCPIIAAGIESWLRGHRMLVDTLTYAGADQLAIARALVAYAQGVPGGDLGIEMDATQMSGVLRDRTFSPYDLPYIGQLLDQLGAVESGFEWRVQVYRDSVGVRHRALRLGYPKLTVGTTDIPLNSPGDVLGWALPEDATQQANAWMSRGASTTSDQASASVPLMSTPLTTPADYTTGWPRLDGTSDYTTVTDPTDLDGHARADLARVLRPVVIPSLTVLSGTTRPPLGSYVRLKVDADDLWYQEGHSARYRVVGMKCAPAERGRADSAALYLEAA